MLPPLFFVQKSPLTTTPMQTYTCLKELINKFTSYKRKEKTIKKAGKRVLFGSLLLVVLMFTMTFTVFAARNIPKKVRTHPNVSGSLYLALNRCEYIKITSAIGLNAKIEREIWDTQSSTSEVYIRYTTKKTGDYKIVFNIYDALTNKKKTSATITIYSREDVPVKKTLVNGKENNFRLSDYKKSTFTFKVQMNSGYTLKKLEYEAYGKPKTTTTKNGNRTETVTESPVIRKSFKNGGSVPTPKYKGGAFIRDYEYVTSSGETQKGHRMDNNAGGLIAIGGKEVIASTIIIITYIDKYTKEETTTSYYVYVTE